MRKLFDIKIILLFYFLLPAIGFAQEESEYKRINKYKSWGFVNQNGDTVIPLKKYKFLNPIDDHNMILAHLGDKKGYINIKEEVLIPFIYDDIGVYTKNGLAPAKKDGKYGYIDRKGKEVIPFEYDRFSYFYESGLAIAKKNDKYGFIDKNGKEIIPIKYEKADQQMADVVVLVSKDNKWAFFSNTGKQLTDFSFDRVIRNFAFIDGRTKTTFFSDKKVLAKKDAKWIYLDEELNELLSFGIFDEAEPFTENGFAIVMKDSVYGIINNKGKYVYNLEYNSVHHPEKYSDRIEMFVLEKDGVYQMLDKNAKPITDFNIEDYDIDNNDKYDVLLIYKTIDGKSKVILEDGEELFSKEEYQEIWRFNGSSQVVAKKNDKYGVINTENEVVLPFLFDDISYTHKTYVVKKQGKYSIFNSDGNQTLDFHYDYLSPCYYIKDSLYIAKKNDKFGVIDKNGTEVIPIKYDTISNWVEYGPQAHFVSKTGKKGLISHFDGKPLVPVIYDELFYYNTNTVFVQIKDKKGIVTINNEEVLPIEYDEILLDWDWNFFRSENNEIYVKKDNRYFVVNNKNEILRAEVPETEVKEKFKYYFRIEN